MRKGRDVAARKTGAKLPLALSLKPKCLDDMIGCAKLAAAIRKLQPGKAWLFSGPTGCGKTSLAGILAESLQCTHQKVFGAPCHRCSGQAAMDRIEINAAEHGGMQDLKGLIVRSRYGPLVSPYRVFILDEAQHISVAGQTLLMKPMESDTSKTIWIICTTEPQKLLPPIRGRCFHFELRELSKEDVAALVERALRARNSTESPLKLVEALIDANVLRPRDILQSVEKFLAGIDARSAVGVRVEPEPEPTTKLEQAKRFLQTKLASGKMRVNTLFDEGAKRGLTKGGLRKAKKELGIRSIKNTFGFGTGEGYTEWELPPKPRKKAPK